MKAQEYLESHWMKKAVWKRLENPIHQERLRQCSSRLKGERFIDVGCGLGHSTEILRRYRPGSWAGLEFYPPAAAQARKLFPDIDFYSARDFYLAPVCGTFDGVVCSEVIEHVEDPEGLVRGLWEITGQTLVVTTPCRPVNDPGHLRLYTRAALEELFRGIPGAKIENSSRFFYVTADRGGQR